MSRGLPLFKQSPPSPSPHPFRFLQVPDAFRRAAATAARAAVSVALPLVTACCCGLTLVVGAARAQSSDPAASAAAPVPVDIGRVFAACKDAVVRIVATDRYGQRAGTGFFIDPHGTIYTHSSVGGQACWDLTVEFRDQRYPAICVLSDPHSGVAMLKITAAATPFLPIGRSDALEIAAPVLVIGYPADLPASPSSGIVAGIDQKVLGEFLAPALVRANLLIQPGEQGAPLLNLRGEAVGLVAGRLGGGGGTAVYALPIKAAEKLRRDYVRFGEPRPGWVGVTISPPPELVNDEGTETRVGELVPDGPAARSGLRASDVLLRVGETPIHRPSDIFEASFYLTGGDNVQFAVSRDGEEKIFTVQAADHPATRRGQEERRRLEGLDGNDGLRLPTTTSQLSLDHGR